MHLLILHDALPADAATIDAADALVQAAHIRESLTALGHTSAIAPVTLDLSEAAAAIRSADCIVNLVESLDGRGSLIHLVPALVESLGVPKTGCPADAIALSSNKLAAKRAMAAAGIPTPPWCEAHSASPAEGRWIIKSVWEHASIGLSSDSIAEAATTDIPQRIAESADRLGGIAFAERFIDGREFNLSILEIGGRPVVLPPAEIEFVGFGPDMPRIVDYAAKWDESSFAYHHTPRRFEYPAADAPLIARITALAVDCWNLFRLRGYARVDFRIDEASRPWILEVNTNPCLSPDAGFMAAAHHADFTPQDVIRHIVSAACAHHSATHARTT